MSTKSSGRLVVAAVLVTSMAACASASNSNNAGSNDNAADDTSTHESSALTCDEFTVSGVIDDRLDADVRSFLEATIDVRDVVAKERATIRTACAAIALDLGAQDSWTALGDTDASLAS